MSSFFEPGLAPSGNAVKVPPGGARTGFVAVQVPDQAKVTTVAVADQGFGPRPGQVEWTLNED